MRESRIQGPLAPPAHLSSPHHVTSPFKFNFSHLPRHPSGCNAKRRIVSGHRNRILGQLTSTPSSIRLVHSRPDSVSIQISSCFSTCGNATFERLVWVCFSYILFLISWLHHPPETGMNKMPRKRIPIPLLLPQEPGINGMPFLKCNLRSCHSNFS